MEMIIQSSMPESKFCANLYEDNFNGYNYDSYYKMLTT